MRHLKTKTIGVGPTDLIPLISTNITALTDCPFMCRSFRASCRFHPDYRMDLKILSENLERINNLTLKIQARPLEGMML